MEKTKAQDPQKTRTSDSALVQLIAVYRKEFGSEWIDAFKQTVKLDYRDLSL
jgi:hypothetical protein